MNNDSNVKENSGRGGAREGAGRPKGKMTEEKKLIRRAHQEMKQRIAKTTDVLLNAQMQLARGEQNLYHVYYTGEGKTRKKHVEIVTDQQTIAEYLADTLDQGGDEYYYIATKSPDNSSINSLFDRAYGRAHQSVDVTSDGEKIEAATIIDLGNIHNVTDQSEAEPSSDDD